MKDSFIISWIFISIVNTSKNSSTNIKNIIAYADLINKTLPLEKELDMAFSYLKQNELIQIIDQKYLITEHGKKLIEKINKEFRLGPNELEVLDEYFEEQLNKKS